MNNENNTEVFQCICGKHFNNKKSLANHKGQCKIYQENKKQQLLQEREAKRLPNGLFKCENPDCEKEHDGSYGSGRFCSEQCKRHYVSKTGSATLIKLGKKQCPKNFKRQSAPYGTWKCSVCGFIANTRQELINHKKEFNHHGISGGIKGSKLSEEHKEKIRIAVSKAVADGKCTGKCKNEIQEQLRCKKISKTMKANPNAGGLRKGSGHGQKGWYKGFFCDSSWELAFVIYCLDHNIEIKRCKQRLLYKDDNNKEHHYYPDFEINGQIYEIKGYEDNLAKIKQKYFPHIKVLKYNELLPILNYVKSVYGKNFISLYEKK